MCNHCCRLYECSLLKRRVARKGMHQSRRNSNILGEPSCARKANLIIASFAQVGQAHPAIATDATEQEPFRYNLVTWRDAAYPLTDGDHLTCPFMTGNNRIAIVAFWTDAPVEFNIAATDT